MAYFYVPRSIVTEKMQFMRKVLPTEIISMRIETEANVVYNFDLSKIVNNEYLTDTDTLAA